MCPIENANESEITKDYVQEGANDKIHCDFENNFNQ